MRIPKYRKHTARNLGFCEWKGQRHYFKGAWNSTVSRDAYLDFIRKNCGEVPTSEVTSHKLTVSILLVRFLVYAKGYYGDGPRGTYANLRYALTPLADSDYGPQEAVKFGPLKLKDYRNSLILRGDSRNYINDQVRRIKKAFRWAVSEELIPPSVSQALDTVAELSIGKSAARETPARMPVKWEWVEPILAELKPTVRSMVIFQWYCAARSDSVCHATAAQIDRSSELWLWRPKHKTEHLGKTVILPIGPKAQAILEPFLTAAPTTDHPLFSPRKANQRAHERYNSTSYRKAVQRAIKRVNKKRAKENAKDPGRDQLPMLPIWSPHLLRHARGHAVRNDYGIEAAQAVLGHDSIDATQLYSAARLELAKRVAKETG